MKREMGILECRENLVYYNLKIRPTKDILCFWNFILRLKNKDRYFWAYWFL